MLIFRKILRTYLMDYLKPDYFSELVTRKFFTELLTRMFLE